MSRNSVELVGQAGSQMPLSGIYLVAAIGLDMRAKICANRLDGSNFSAVRVRKLDDDSARPASSWAVSFSGLQGVQQPPQFQKRLKRNQRRRHQILIMPRVTFSLKRSGGHWPR